MFFRTETRIEVKPEFDIQSKVKLVSLGIVIIATYVLTAVGAFTPGWIVVTTKIGNVSESKYHGIFKKSDNASGFIIAACFSIVLAVATFLLVAFYYGRAIRELYKFGYSRYARGNFYAIASGAILNIAFTIVAIPLIAKAVADLNTKNPYPFVTIVMGYSAWLCVGSVVLAFGIIGISMYIALEDCVDEEESPRNDRATSEIPEEERVGYPWI